MSVRAINWAFKQQVGKPSAKLVLVNLADHADDDRKCWPSLRKIAERTELSRDTVVRSIRLLKLQGFIRVVHRHNGRSATSNMYYLNCESEHVDSAAGVSERSAAERSSTARSSSANCMPGVVALSDQRSNTTGTSIVLPSDPNHHTEASKETSKESFSLCGHIEKPEDLIQYAEAKQLLGKLSEAAFGDPLHETEWPRELEELLKQALPIKRKDWELIDWFYRLSADHQIFTVTYRRQSLRAVLQNLRIEPQKIRSARQAIKRDGFLSPSESETLRTGWTVQLRSAAHDEFPDLILPERYDMVPPDIQQRIANRIAMNEAGWTPQRIIACKMEFPHTPESEFVSPFERLPLHVQEQIKYRVRENEPQQPVTSNDSS